MPNPKISVIVPVYNVEKYLPRCIDSILAQTFTEFELLLIDDGSSDNSGKICDEYAKNDKRIRVFHQENGGVSSARQVGIDKAQGIYSIHADGDDWVEKTMLERMYKEVNCNGCDMLISDYYVDYKDRTVIVEQKSSSNIPTEILKDILMGKLFGSLWHKLIRHDIYKKYNVRFINGINYCEDVLILVQLLQKPLRISFFHKAFYHYNKQNVNSITCHYTLDSYKMRKLYVEHLENLLPSDFDDVISYVALDVKLEAFANGVLTKREFYAYKPSSLYAILHHRCRKKLKICLLFAYCRFYGMAQIINRIKK